MIGLVIKFLGAKGIALVLVSALSAGLFSVVKFQNARIDGLKQELAQTERALDMAVGRAHAIADARDEDIAALKGACDANAKRAADARDRASAQCDAQLKECRGEVDVPTQRDGGELDCIADVRVLGILDRIQRATAGDIVPRAHPTSPGYHPSPE